MVGYVNVDGDVEDGIDVEDATGVDVNVVNDVDVDYKPENNCDANEDLEAGLKRDDSADWAGKTHAWWSHCKLTMLSFDMYQSVLR